jgi:hypothetical protein
MPELTKTQSKSGWDEVTLIKPTVNHINIYHRQIPEMLS